VFVLAVLLAFSIVKNGVSSRTIFFQLLLIFFLIRNVYYLGTKNVIPFGDAYWDYAVEKIFLEQGHISTIEGIVRPTEAGGISQLTWYSGWPFLHLLGISFSMVTGLDPLYLNWVLPNLLALASFVFVYLMLEKFRVRLNFPKRITVISLLLYTIIPEAIFWQMQFVRQSLALVLFVLIIYFLYILSFESFDRRYFLILGILVLSLAISHHVTAFTLSLFLFLFSAFNIIAKRIGGWKRLKWIVSPVRSDLFSNFGFLMFFLMFLWWYRNVSIIFPTIVSRLVLFFESLGIEDFYSQVVITYPSVIRPAWVPLLLGFRDLLIYVPAIVGLLVLWRNKFNFREKFLIIYSVLAFGFILLVNILLRIEPLRIILFMAPFLVFLSSLAYDQIRHVSKTLGKIVVSLVIVLLICTSFLGLWAHNFAPIHLYDSSVDPDGIGETSPDFIRMKPFFEKRINITHFQDVRADVISQLVYLLDPEDYDKIKLLPVENFDQLERKSTLVCSFNDLNLYMYYGHVWSPIEATKAKNIQYELENYLNGNFNQIYKDGSISIWMFSDSL
jgi:hypothetical protein